VLRLEGVDPGAFIWVHANADPDPRRHVAVADLGAWVSFDGVSQPVDNDVARLVRMKAAGLLGRVMISHDAGWFDPAKPHGGSADYKGYTVLFEHLLPALRREGFTEAEITQLTVENPAKAYAVGVKEQP
jgi:phosphotriesterase-related protein